MSTIKSSSEHLTLNADGSNKDVKIQNNGSESVIVKSDGSVGVGTSSPSVKSEIQHSGTGGFPATSGTTQTYGILRLNSGGGWTSALDIGNNGGNGAWIQSTDTSNLATNYALYLNKNGGQVRVGSGGLTFNGDTAAANALDDYEEGTWTPTLDGATATLGNTTGYYTKIGNVVYFCWYSKASTLSSSSGNAQIHGLPFTSSNDADRYVVFSYAHGNALDGNSRGGYVSKNATKMSFVDDGAIDSATFINGSNKYIMVSGFYYVD